MRITITTTDTALTFMRRAGYGFQKEGSGETAFVRRVSGSPFPRFHAYVMETASRQPQAVSQLRELTINLHVDQKAPTYQRGRAHSGEYDGSPVEQEAARLRELAQQASTGSLGRGRYSSENGKGSAGKGFWQKLFG